MSNPQIPLTGNIGAGGVFPLINCPTVNFATDANHTMSYPDMSGSSGFLVVTSSVSLTATRNLIAPLIVGFNWAIQNATTGGHSIVVIGATGTGVTIASGYTMTVYCDGTNYVTLPSASGGTVLSVTATAPMTSTGGTNPNVACPTASASQTGLLLSADWSTFNGKQNALGYTPAHSGANSDITSLTGLTTPLPTTEGGSGTAGGTGYRYGNGASPDTYSTTLPSNSSQVILLPAYNLGDIVGPATFYISSYGVGSNGDEVTDNNNFKMPMAGTASNLYVGTSQAIPGGTTIVITLQKNTTDTSLTCTLSADAQTTDLVHTVPVAAGDSLQFKVVASGNVAIANWLVIGFVYGTATPPLEDY